MQPLSRTAACLGLTLVGATPAAWAAYGQIDGISASATSVLVGDWIDFSVNYTVITSSSSGGGSDPVEPAPAEGNQTWYVNWYNTQSETLTGVWIDGAANYSDYPTAASGSAYSGSFNFSLQFPQAGHFDLAFGGGFDYRVDYAYSSEYATRDCWNNDPGAGNELVCSSWEWHYDDSADWYSSGGNLTPASISVDALASPVPEPPALLLAAAGVTAIGVWRRRRCRQAQGSS